MKESANRESAGLRECTDPAGHDWQATLNFTPKHGVTPVSCSHCGEIGFHFKTKEKVDG